MTAGDWERQASVLRYWHAIEMFDPQGIPVLPSRRELAAREPGSRCVEAVPFLAGEPAPKLPWQEGHLRYHEPPKDATYGSEWRHTVYGGVFSFGAVRKVLAERLGFTEPEDFAGTRKEDTESALFAFTVDQRGLLLDGTGAFSSCAWASGRLDGVRRGQRTALEGFEKVSGECQAAMERLLAKPVQYPLSLPARMAYDGMMVYGTRWEQFPARPRDAYPSSCWIDVKRRDGTGKWVPAQGEALLKVLRKLRDDRFGVGLDQVYVLSPFRDVVTECRKWIGAALRDEPVPRRTRASFTREHVGTVHSMQGREADVVIFILGTDRSASGRARQWVGNPPNLLNVAVSRARRRLFVIGCFSEWTDVPSFGVFDDPARFPVVPFRLR